MIRAFFIILLICSVHPAMAAESTIKLDYDFQRAGGDYTHFIVVDVRECVQECERSRRCQAFDFYESDHSCWLKSRIYAPRRYAGVISGVKRHRSSQVATVQRLLAQQHYYPGAADGVMGRKTRTALEKYQIDHRLAVTGRIDTATLISLGLLQPTYPDELKQVPSSDKPEKDLHAYVKTIGVAYLQAADSIYAGVLAKIPAGTTLQVISEGREWYRVFYHDKQGYVLSEAVEKQ